MILSKILKKSQIKILSTLSSFFRDTGIRFIHLEPDEIGKIKDLAIKYNLDFEDAIHLYLSKKVGELISNDKELIKQGAKV